MRITYRLIEHFASGGGLKALGLCVFLKLRFVNSCLYAGSLRKMGKSLGISAASVRKYLARAEKAGLVRHHNGNYCFRKLHDLADDITVSRSRIGFIIPRNVKTLREVIDILKYEILKCKKAQFDHLRQQSDRYDASARRRERKHGRFTLLPGVTTYYASYKRIGAHLGTKKTSAVYFMKKLLKAGKARKIKNAPLVILTGNSRALQFAESACLKHHYQDRYGRVMRMLPNSWSF